MINKIYNEDCLIGIKNIPDNSVDLVIIDPPYDICTKGGKKGKSRLGVHIKNLEKELINNDLVNAFDYSILDELIRVMKNINIYISITPTDISIYLLLIVLKLFSLP